MTPRSVFWEVTNRCNLSCEHCYNKNYLNDKSFKYPLSEGLGRCDKIIEAGFKRVIFLGGEPFADRNLLTYVQVFHDAGIECDISTNGTLITPEVARDIAMLRVKLINVSLDGGIPELNDAIRGKGTYKRIVAGIRNLAKNRQGEFPRISIACTLARENDGGYRELFELARENGIVDIFINKFLRTNESSLGTDSVRDFIRKLDKLCADAKAVGEFYLYLPTMPKVADALSRRHGFRVYAKEQTCSAVDEAVLLADDGQVYPCSMARVAHDDYATPLTEGILDTIRQEPMRRFVRVRQQMRTCLPNVCRECEYVGSCATRCVLTNDQTKYFLGCEAVATLGAALFAN